MHHPIHTHIYTPAFIYYFIIAMDIEGGSWDPAFLVETSNDTSSVQTVTAAQEDDLLGNRQGWAGGGPQEHQQALPT